MIVPAYREGLASEVVARSRYSSSFEASYAITDSLPLRVLRRYFMTKFIRFFFFLFILLFRSNTFMLPLAK